MNIDNNHVLVGMSGGVDSSVAAVKLKNEGFKVTGFTITPYKIEDDCRVKVHEKSCCSFSGIIDANNVCEKYGMEHFFVDLSEEFKNQVVDYFINEYLSGKTPNPCVMCNPTIKWDSMLKKADEVGAQYVATGHYSKIKYDDNSGRYILTKGFDKSKDQTYFLWRLSQSQLSRTLFPLAEFDKPAVRNLAHEFELLIADKVESQEICFIPDNDYHRFLKNAVPDIDSKIGKGDIIFNDKKVGVHEGFPFYTIGQRKGLGISNEKPLFVKKIDSANNIIEVGLEEELLNSGLIANNINLIKYSEIDEEKVFNVKIRYRDPGFPAKCSIDSENNLRVEFLEKKKSITPGQSVVIYEDEDVVAGGIIQEWF
jgi:tRNA-specific 2-thiouridylase